MINGITYTMEWINKKNGELKKGKSDKGLIEKATKALHLLEELSKTELEFIFKGGTSLLLLLDELHRFSIDIDIITDEENMGEVIENELTKVISNSNVFTRYEENKRTNSSGVPKAHYKFYYESLVGKKDSHILLDVLYEKNHYTEVIQRSIDCSLVKCDGQEIKVTMPSIDCILGDKLTAYAPNTTGIPYGVGKELEIIKQLFDVANLFEEMKDIDAVRETFKQMAEQELSYRGKHKELSYIDVLDDIFNTSKALSAEGRVDAEDYKKLADGVRRIKGFILTQNYVIESAINSASKAAYLALILKHDIKEIEKFDPSINLNVYVIDDLNFPRFERIKKRNPEAYFYWHKSIALLHNIK